MNVEVEGNTKTKIFSLFMLTEYNNAPCWPPKFLYGLLDLSVDRERTG